MLPPVQFGSRPEGPRFGKSLKVLADTREDAFLMGEAVRNLEISRNHPATLVTFPDTYYVFSGKEAIEASEPPEDLVDELAECSDLERDTRLMNYMQLVHQRLTAAAETLDFRMPASGRLIRGMRHDDD